MSERNQFVPLVDVLRDLAVELINKSAKYDEKVEAELTTFNQRWQDMDARIKVSDNFQLLLCLCSFW